MTKLRCQTCGTPDVMVISPGSEDITGPGEIVIKRGEPIRCWCEKCALADGWPQQEKINETTLP